jgi:hypothetical protein
MPKASPHLRLFDDRQGVATYLLEALLTSSQLQQFRNDICLRSSRCRRLLWFDGVIRDRANSHSRGDLTVDACTGV